MSERKNPGGATPKLDATYIPYFLAWESRPEWVLTAKLYGAYGVSVIDAWLKMLAGAQLNALEITRASIHAEARFFAWAKFAEVTRFLAEIDLVQEWGGWVICPLLDQALTNLYKRRRADISLLRKSLFQYKNKNKILLQVVANSEQRDREIDREIERDGDAAASKKAAGGVTLARDNHRKRTHHSPTDDTHGGVSVGGDLEFPDY